VALSHIHQMKVMHRDIKPENLLIGDCGALKFTDFGLSKFFAEGKAWFTDDVGSREYKAPEVIGLGEVAVGEDGQRRCWSRGYNEKADVWSVGVVLYILLCGVTPFYGTPEEKTAQILSGPIDIVSKYWDGVSDAAKRYVLRLMERDISKRPTAEEALGEHPCQRPRLRRGGAGKAYVLAPPTDPAPRRPPRRRPVGQGPGR